MYLYHCRTVEEKWGKMGEGWLGGRKGHLRGKGVDWGPKGPVVLRRTQPFPQSPPAPEAPIIVASSTDKWETDRDQLLTQSPHHSSGLSGDNIHISPIILVEPQLYQ
ncbi:uncharacterized protein EI90DRAFT_3022468 [Cantharellus anzutake]|uniref:uncharacterized protein n=1 Tax=Cantharellus anzutake TaxID=1750568 RepID=UPI001906094E|nr:uncharacterized protein EI90DRAFT_3022468 [Cantharellus anzutake]KAF8314121.1 hypothetical protein EI90DRAFT_3022468 [Cantharellus anzutake]